MMKPMFNFLLALTAVIAATASDYKPEPVLDTEGKPVIGGRSYYLVPAVPGQGGGLGLAGRGDKKCPLDIVQESSEENDGIPVKISDWDNHVGYVPERESLRIEMDIGDTTCCRQTYWKVENKFDEERKQSFVMADSKDIWSTNFFDLLKSGAGYKFVWCPTYDYACSSKLCSPECRDVGIFVDEKGVRRLAFSSKPFVVKFKKAKIPRNLSSKTI